MLQDEAARKVSNRSRHEIRARGTREKFGDARALGLAFADKRGVRALRKLGKLRNRLRCVLVKHWQHARAKPFRSAAR